jgi:branched-chain amino acid transport system substrate-binding protein
MMLRVLVLLLAPLCVMAAPLQAEDVTPVRLGVLTDMSGSMASAAGHGSREATEMAVEDVKAAGLLTNVTIIHGDYQNRGEVALHICENWIKKENVDAVLDVPNAAIASRLMPLLREHDRLLLVSRSNSESLYNNACQHNSLSWLYDRDTLTNNLVRALVHEGRKRWFILGSEDGYSLEVARLVKKHVAASGAEVVGEAQFRKRMSGITMVLDRIGDVKADIIFLAFDRPDILHLLRNWPQEKKSPPLAFTPLYISDVHRLIAGTKEKYFPPFFTIKSFYWNQDDKSRAWSERFAKRNRGAMPGEIHAAVYSSVRDYLQSIAAIHGKKPADVMAHMRTRAVDDPLFNGSTLRADGLVTQNLRLLAYKPVEERKEAWDYMRVVRVMPAAEQALPDAIDCAAR